MEKVFKLIVAGSRNFVDYTYLCKALDFLLSKKVAEGYKVIIVSGKAKGADSLGEKYALERGYEIAEFPAQWRNNGRIDKGAGFKRNIRMAEYAAPNGGCVIFRVNMSNGSTHMKKVAEEKGLQVKTFDFKLT